MPDNNGEPERPAECCCFKTLGFPSCQRGHGFCPFLDPGGRMGNWRERLRKQIRFYREHEPWRLTALRASRRESLSYVRRVVVAAERQGG